MSCSRDLEKYRSTRSLADWKQFKKTVKCTKQLFFDQKIQKILNKARTLEAYELGQEKKPPSS